MNRRSGWVLPLLLVLLVAVPIAEVWLLLQVGRQIGLLPTLVLLVGTAALGGWLLRREGTRAWRALNAAFDGGRMPTGELADAALVLVGGVLLMLPGFVTDLIGLIFLLPLTRPAARKLLAYLVARRVARSGVRTVIARYDTGNLIEGETVAEDLPRPPPPDFRVIRGELDEETR